MTCLHCDHDMWDHEFIDQHFNGDMVFGACEIEGCDCDRYDDP